ncbi:MAG: hypothetical protein BRD44_04655 [Bacteroidetes bacterium QS_7_67_15]|nr:MAG: hypothetical protein BRD44_04655 [Bacteroidetes bacterium QS_7_67_15]
MIHLVYTSTAVDRMDDDALDQILRESHERNERRNVTGMLLYRDGTFLQVLEGDDEDVLHVYDLIKGDERHRGLVNVLQEPIGERSFSDWKMSFRRVEDADLKAVPEGYSRFMENGFDGDAFEDEPNHALEILSYFREE